MKLFFFCLSLTVITTGFSQVYDPEHVNTKAVSVYEKALDLLRDGQIAESIPLLTQSLKIDSNFVDAYLSMAGALGQLKKYGQAVTLYEKAKQKDTAYFVVYNLPYSINLAGEGKFEEALAAVNAFLKYP
ncbi:MAG: flagellar motor protein MotB, partial [Sediminibacterium sp.]